MGPAHQPGGGGQARKEVCMGPPLPSRALRPPRGLRTRCPHSRGESRRGSGQMLTWATKACAGAGGVGVHHVHTALGLLALEGMAGQFPDPEAEGACRASRRKGQSPRGKGSPPGGAGPQAPTSLPGTRPQGRALTALSEDLLATSTRRPARRMARWSAMSQSAGSAAERGAGLPGGGGGPGLAP